MRTRTLHAAAIILTAAGLTTAAVGLDPAAPALTARVGILLVIAAAPLIIAAQSRRAAIATAVATADELAAARLDGYRTGLAHAALGLLTPPPDGHTAPPSYARGHLHAVNSDTERKAE